MEMNYLIVAAVLLAVVILIAWIIRRNQKDKKKFEKEIINSELKPEAHKEDKV
jgi:preprotein translocase subunit YajC